MFLEIHRASFLECTYFPIMMRCGASSSYWKCSHFVDHNYVLILVWRFDDPSLLLNPKVNSLIHQAQMAIFFYVYTLWCGI